MNKTKVKLNSLYGQMLGGNTAFGVCSRKVREIPCDQCLNFQKCMREGKPVSNLGAYMAWLELKALPDIENELRPSCADGLKLEAHTPNMDELNKDACAVVRVYNEKGNRRIICRVLLTDYDYNEIKLRAMVVAAYFNKYGKTKNGKIAKN